MEEMKIGFIGFGNMAQAMARGLVATEALPAASIGACARDFDKLRRNTEPFGFRPFAQAADLVAFADLVVVAVKPHQVAGALEPLRKALHERIVVSVAAGVTFDDYEGLLLPGTPHLSTVPNTPVAVGEGIIVCERRHSLSAEAWGRFERIFSRIGMLLTVDTPLLSVAGTVCGCGPAFVAMFLEALADAAVKHGIPRADAYRMASQMVVGTGKLQLATGTHPAAMKDAVCSPGGTTIVGVAALERRAFRAAVIDAVDAIEAKR